MIKNKFSLNKKLSAYATMGAAFLATSSEVQGTIVHTDPADVTVATDNTYFGVDIDGQSITATTTSSSAISSNSAIELFFSVYSTSVGVWGQGYWYGSDTNEIVANDELVVGFNVAMNFASGSLIQSPITHASDGGGSLGQSGSSNSSQFVPPPQTGFLGVQFQIAGQNHYGWVRVTLNSIGSVTVHDFAYEDQPNTCIAAGATSGPAICPVTVSSAGNVPTLSEWGLLNLAILLMTFGTIYLIQPNFSLRKKRIKE
ncbi:MAG: hypothetical protein AB8B69_07220 [Chitinophagales bacterium]